MTWVPLVHRRSLYCFFLTFIKESFRNHCHVFVPDIVSVVSFHSVLILQVGYALYWIQIIYIHKSIYHKISIHDPLNYSEVMLTYPAPPSLDHRPLPSQCHSSSSFPHVYCPTGHHYQIHDIYKISEACPPVSQEPPTSSSQNRLTPTLSY